MAHAPQPLAMQAALAQVRMTRLNCSQVMECRRSPLCFALLLKAKKMAEKLGVSSGAKPAEVRSLPIVPASTCPHVAVAQSHFTDELVINEYPQKARYKITHRETLVPSSYGQPYQT